MEKIMNRWNNLLRNQNAECKKTSKMTQSKEECEISTRDINLITDKITELNETVEELKQKQTDERDFGLILLEIKRLGNKIDEVIRIHDRKDKEERLRKAGYRQLQDGTWTT